LTRDGQNELPPDLSKADTKRIKKVAVAFLETLKAEKLKIDHWRDKETTRDAVRITIRNFLWNDETGLPVNSYSEEEVVARAEDVYRHIFRAYPSVPLPYYESVAA
jgi:type I restriction enzyme R subunit